MLNTRRHILIFKSKPHFSKQPAHPFRNRSLGAIARPNIIYVPKFSTHPNTREVEKIMSESTIGMKNPTVQNPIHPRKEKVIHSTKGPKIPTILRGGAKNIKPDESQNVNRAKRTMKEGTIKAHKTKKLREENYQNATEANAKNLETDDDKKSTYQDGGKKEEDKKSTYEHGQSKEKKEDLGQSLDLKENAEKEKNIQNEQARESKNDKQKKIEAEEEADEDESEKNSSEEEEQEETDDSNLNTDSEVESNDDNTDTDEEEKNLANALLHPLKVFFCYVVINLLRYFSRYLLRNSDNFFVIDANRLSKEALR